MTDRLHHLAAAPWQSTSFVPLHDRKDVSEPSEAEPRPTEARPRWPRYALEGGGANIIGAESGLKNVMPLVDLVKASDMPVLLLGETGSGKEVLAHAIHAGSPRAGRPLVRVNCGAIPSELVDSELFGHERGSFTGAVGLRKGWFERAHGGTLLLDEVGELPPAAQVRLLRVLQDGSFERVGGQSTLTVDVRIIAATHRDLQVMVTKGLFRQDLWYRIAVFPIRLPSLRERPEDIPPLAAHMVRQAARRLHLDCPDLSDDDIEVLLAYAWPGNVRELMAVMECAVLLGGGNALDVPSAMRIHAATPTAGSEGPPPGASAAIATAPSRGTGEHEFKSLDVVMADHIRAALIRTRGSIGGPAGAARLLQINPHTLRARMRKLGIDWQSVRRAERATL